MEQENGWIEEWFETATQCTAILDETGNVIRCNRAFLNLSSLKKVEIIDTPLWLIPWPALNRQNRSTLKKSVLQAAGGNRFQRELEIRIHKQPAKIIQFSIKPILGDRGTLKYLITEWQDITALRRTSAALFQVEARFKTIFEEAGIGIVIKGVNGRMLDCNPAFQSMSGYSVSELRRLDYLDITHPLDKKTSRKLFNELISGERESYSIEKRYIHKDGHAVWVHMNASLVRDQNGEASFVIAMVENITATIQIEAELSELQHRLTQSREKERLRLAQDLHDGPLQEIIGISFQMQELENSEMEDMRRQQLQAARSAIQQLTHSIRSICSELRPPTLLPFGLEKTILSHIANFRTAHPQIEVNCRLDHDGQTLPEPIRIAYFRIYQEALTNILRHAQAKSIKIRFKLTLRQAMLEIADDGIGFELPARWVNFARQGHLGLVGAMERARDIEGKFEVISSSGHGTTIRVLVPLKEEGVAQPLTDKESQK